MRADSRSWIEKPANKQPVSLLVMLVIALGCQSGPTPRQRADSVIADLPTAATSPPRESAQKDVEATQNDVEATQNDVDQVTYDQLPAPEAPSAGVSTADVSPANLPTEIIVDGMIDAEATVPAGQDNTLQQLESIALAGHPAIIAARGQVEQARGQYVQAGLPLNPVFQYQGDEIGNESSGGLHSIRLSQQFVTANKLGLAQQVQAHVIAQRQADLQRAELEVLTRVRIAFIRTWIAQQRAELSNQIVELTEQSVQSARALLEAQEVSKVALLQTQVESQQARIVAENAATQLAANRRALAAAVGLQQLSPGLLVSDEMNELKERPWELMIEEITSISPELSAAGSRLQQARWALQLACAQVTPNVTGQFGAGVDSFSEQAYAAIGVSVPLPVRNRNQGNIRSARAGITTAAARTESTRLDLQSRLADAVGRYQTARERHTRLRTQLLPNAEETFELSRVAFDAGESNYLELLTAQRTLVTTELRILTALEQAKQASAEIDGLLVTVQ